MNIPILKFENVGKLYRLGEVGLGSLRGDVERWWKKSILGKPDPYLKIGEINDRSKKSASNIVWALKDITFQIDKGERVGIIGRNGAGKSTLLKILSRITAPTVGSIKIKGKIASLLEVGTGFHNELSGRENIYMNGAILGMTKAEIKRKFDEIVEFAGVERYIDTPIKRYSSGMIVRLGFAVAAFLEPDILVVDEVLAVGDAEFQKKALGKMQDISTQEGRTVLFVSHNMASIRSLCTHGIVLENGELIYSGGINKAIELYSNSGQHQNSKKIKERIKHQIYNIEITEIKVNGSSSIETIINPGQETLKIEIRGNAKEKFSTDLMVIFKTKEGVPLASLAEGHYKGSIQHIEIGEFIIERTIQLPKFLCAGDLKIDLFLHHPMVEYQMMAPECCEINIVGTQEGFGKPGIIYEHGFLGLETKMNE